MNTHSNTPRGNSHPNRWRQGGTKLKMLLTGTAIGAALAVSTPTVLNQLNGKPKAIKNPETMNLTASTQYNNNLDDVTIEKLVNATKERSAEGKSADSQAFNGLWNYLSTCGMVDQKKWLPGVKIRGHRIFKKTIIDKNGDTIIDAEHHSHVEAFTNPDDSDERVIILSWDNPYDEDVVLMKGKNVCFKGSVEFRQYGENGPIRYFKEDQTAGTGRQGPTTIDANELEKILRTTVTGLKIK